MHAIQKSLESTIKVPMWLASILIVAFFGAVGWMIKNQIETNKELVNIKLNASQIAANSTNIGEIKESVKDLSKIRLEQKDEHDRIKDWAEAKFQPKR